jgi:hypothetical protein
MRRIIIWGFVVLVALSLLTPYVYAQSDIRIRDGIVVRSFEGRGGVPLWWDGFFYGQYAGNNWDCIFFNYTGAGQNIVRLQGDGADVVTIDKTGNLVLAGTMAAGNELTWTGGNVTYVPLNGDIQTYVTAATAGDTLVLASGVYTITSTITINKELNIRGQGRSGFVTTPITASHGTLISSSTAAVTAFSITNDNVRIANLSINLTGAGSTGISTSTDLAGIVFDNLDLIINSTGANLAFSIHGSDTVMRDSTFYITSSDSTAAGVYFFNNATTNISALLDAFNVTGTAVGANGYAYAFACVNGNNANTLTLNLSNSVARALGGSALDVAVASTSVTTNNSTVNCYMCNLDGAVYDAYQTGTNELNLGGSVIENGTILGTVTYRATMTSEALAAEDMILTGLTTYTPSTAQVIDAVGDAILADATIIQLNPDGDYTLTSTPTIVDGTTGQIIYITCANGEVNTVTVQDQDTLGNSNLQLGANTRAVSGKDVLSLLFDGTDWIEISFANN